MKKMNKIRNINCLLFCCLMALFMTACTNKNSVNVGQIKSEIIESYKADTSRENHLAKGKLTIDGATMELSIKTIGNADENGYPLYIALHGGGVEDAQLSKEQYEIMADYYYNTAITSGVYVATHGIIARYDEHYRPESFEFYDEIIEEAIKYYNVDPNRVYLMGFSSGGDGVYAIAPMMADRFAAVNMSAGFPHVHALENMCNLPICIQVGEKDDAYDRCYIAAQYDGWLGDYYSQYGFGFEHDTFIHIGGTHNGGWTDVGNEAQSVVASDTINNWLNKKDYNTKYVHTGAVEWLNQNVRNPYPEQLVWNTSIYAYKRKNNAFYWLNRSNKLDHATVEASYNKGNNTVTINTKVKDEGILKVYLNEEMLDLNSKVTFIVDSQKFTISPVKSEYVMRKTFEERKDVNYIFEAEVDVVYGKDGSIKLNVIDKESDEVMAEDEYAFVNENGLLIISDSILGSSFDEIKSMLGEEEFGAYQKWDYGQYSDMMWSYTCTPDKESITFFFYKNQCVEVRYEKDGAVDSNVVEAVRDYFGARFTCDGIPSTEGSLFPGILCNGGSAHYYIDNNIYDNKDHMSQKYIYNKIF